LSAASQTPLAQVSAAAAGVHVPLSAGPVCGGSTGSAVPLGSRAVQTRVVSLHHEPLAQSTSTRQPPGGTHDPLALQLAERHTTPAVAAVHGPSAFA
jgi:hypothetical protein